MSIKYIDKLDVVNAGTLVTRLNQIIQKVNSIKDSPGGISIDYLCHKCSENSLYGELDVEQLCSRCKNLFEKEKEKKNEYVKAKGKRD